MHSRRETLCGTRLPFHATCRGQVWFGGSASEGGWQQPPSDALCGWQQPHRASRHAPWCGAWPSVRAPAWRRASARARRLKKMEKERMQDAAGENLDKEDKKKKKCAPAVRLPCSSCTS